MKLAWKLLAAPLLTAVVVLSAGQLNALLLSRAAEANLATMNAQLEDYRTLSNAQEQLAQIHTGVYRTVALVASLDDAKIKSARADLVQQLAGVQRVAASIGEAHADDAELRQSSSQLAPLIAKYLKQADEAIDLSSVDPNTGIAAMQSADSSFAVLTQTMRAMIKRVETASADTVQAADSQARRTRWLLSGLGLLAAAIAVCLSWLMQRKLTHELQRATEIAGEVAAGNLSIDASSERSDEVGDLVRALGRMTAQLGGSMQAVLAASASIRTASAEIASGNMDLSERTEQTASSLQQAASSMDQLTSTVRQSASSALEANRLAASAAEVAARGGRVVAQVVSTMEDINSSSRRIGDIIGVIDSIAFQTNILALNAAVEAARAGEQGRGFAVVAGEVRSLAQRSAQAAREIKGLIGASVEKVEGGSKLVADAGQTMGEIVGSVERVSAIIGEISTAAAEQSRGLDLVNGSVVKLDQMTQQNAALVEQSAAAAESMKDQAIKLAEIVDTFKLP
ncbi:methyl-accepting chemotaxis protein [Roseateles sp.]|uniref:methyl-accepting chemotaxis protein n=1 Tax=Roseateles sp. TaxID=1971397 RepID=UPI00286C8733|nr:methyl-accepting chemotaxis protein [Roseateles sp.]